MLIPALQKDDELLADIASRHNDGESFGLWWLGQSGFLLKHAGHQLLFDPYLSDSLTRKYAETDKPHLRMSERVIDPARLHGIEVATSSHNHSDHLDAETLIPLIRNNPGITLVLPSANEEFAAQRLQAALPAMAGLDHGTRLTLGPFHFTGVAAAHNEIERDRDGRCRFLGFLVSFANRTIYHSGDTLWHHGLVEMLAPRRPDVALLPINGFRKERRVAGNLNGAEAAALAKAAAAGCVVPCHYDMFTFNTESTELFEHSCVQLQQPFRVLRGGEALHSDTLATNS